MSVAVTWQYLKYMTCKAPPLADLQVQHAGDSLQNVCTFNIVVQLRDMSTVVIIVMVLRETLVKHCAALARCSLVLKTVLQARRPRVEGPMS
jgi:hypothetical protein